MNVVALEDVAREAVVEVDVPRDVAVARVAGRRPKPPRGCIWEQRLVNGRRT